MQQGLLRIALTSTVCVLLMLLVARLPVSIPGGEGRSRLSASEIKPVGDIFEGVEIRQEFPTDGTKIRTIELQLATYGRQNKGKLTLEVSQLVKGRWRPLAVRRMLKRQLVDCAWQSFGFAPPLDVKKGQPVALTLTADRDAADAITWWTSPGVNTKDHQLFVNGEPHDGYAHFSVEYEPIRGKAGYPKMRARLWRRLTVFLDPLGQTMLAGGFLLALFGLVHLSVHVPRRQRDAARAKSEADFSESAGLIDYARGALTPSGLRAAFAFVRAQRERRLYRLSVQYASLALVGFCVFVLACSWLARLGTPLNPAADSAILEVNLDDAIRGKMLVGPYSRFGWSHPGPLFFYVLAPLYYLTGRNPVAIHLGMALLNGSAVLATVLIVRQRVGEVAARWAAWIGVLFLIGLSPHGLSQFWNPNALAAPFLLFLSLCAAAISGSSRSLIAAGLVGSFLVQTHVGTMGVVGVLLVVAVSGSVFLARFLGIARPSNRTLQAMALAVVIAWLPPLIEALVDDGGNLRKLGRFFLEGERVPREGNLRLSLIAFVRQAAALPLGSDTFPLETSEFGEGRALVVALALALAFGTAWICYRRRAWFGAALAAVSLLGCVLGLISITQVQGPLLSYIFWWCAALPVPAWIAWGVAAQNEAQLRTDTSPSVVRLGFSFAVLATVGCFVWSVFNTPLAKYLDSQDAPRVAGHILGRFPAIRHEPLELIAPSSSYTSYAATYATLRRRGVDALVPRSWDGMFGTLHLSSGPTHAAPRYAAYLLEVGRDWDEKKPEELPDVPPKVFGQVQVWLVDRNAAPPGDEFPAQRSGDDG